MTLVWWSLLVIVVLVAIARRVADKVAENYNQAALRRLHKKPEV